ncbi:MAG: hypothetical protein FJ020_03345 [Chloroflexi bacterium]|nr:hypothetical protein [Chloroflexota bacterium]
MLTRIQTTHPAPAPGRNYCSHQNMGAPADNGVPYKRVRKAKPGPQKPVSGDVAMRWFPCGDAGTWHIIGPCPRCRHTKWGLLLGTMDSGVAGLVRLWCAACEYEVYYYADAREKQIWRREQVEAIRD